MSYNLAEEYKVVGLVGSTIVTADLNGTAVDLEVYGNDAMAVLTTGLITSTAATYAINIQGSTTSNGTFTTLASFNTFAGTAYSYKVAAIPVNLTDSPLYKYVRAQVDVTANSGTVSGVIAVNIIVKPVTATFGLNSGTPTTVA